MARRMTIRRTDSNQSAIVESLRGVGATIILAHMVGGGMPDIVVGYRGKNYLLEIKGPRGRLTREQEHVLAIWRGQVAVVSSAEEALQVIGAEAV